MLDTLENPETTETSESFRDKILRKCGESVAMKQKFFSDNAEKIEAMCRDMAKQFAGGNKLLVMGNGLHKENCQLSVKVSVLQKSVIARIYKLLVYSCNA